jgi:phospholipase C
MGGLLLAGSGLDRALAATAATGSAATRAALPAPASSGIDHIVVLMMENRSFDHYLGWLPGANGRQAGLSYPDRQGARHATHHLDIWEGCGVSDPDHSYEGGRVEYNAGRCDGWLQAGSNDLFSIGYYEAADLAFYGHAAPYWTVCDHYFAPTMGPTYPNRFYMHSAQTDRTDDSTTTTSMPTIWDLLASAGVSHTYYFSDIPFTALWGTKYLGISRPYLGFLADCALGQLPAVSFLDPRFEDEGTGTSGDDHPHADIRVGQSFVNQVYEAVTSSPVWDRTLLVVTYDEWGGFFDHVAPSVAPDAKPSNGLRGFRVPALVVSPRAHRATVAHNVYDHTSVLKMIEWRWGLPALTPRDAAARNLAEVLDFRRPPDLTAPRWSVPLAVPLPCVSGVTSSLPALPVIGPVPGPTEHQLTWAALSAQARDYGFRGVT